MSINYPSSICSVVYFVIETIRLGSKGTWCLIPNEFYTPHTNWEYMFAVRYDTEFHSRHFVLVIGYTLPQLVPDHTLFCSKRGILFVRIIIHKSN